MIGRYLESYVAQQLRPACAIIGANLNHLRSSGGDREIDIIIEHDNQLTAFEIKASTTIKPHDTKHLRWLRDQMEARFHLGAVLYTGTHTYELDHQIWAIPITYLTQPMTG